MLNLFKKKHIIYLSETGMFLMIITFDQTFNKPFKTNTFLLHFLQRQPLQICLIPALTCVPYFKYGNIQNIQINNFIIALLCNY